MFTKRLYTLITLAVTAALLAASLPTGASIAQENPQDSQPNCPPTDPTSTQDPNFIKSLPPECRKAYRQSVSSEQQADPQPGPFSVGGPDAFGYTFDNTVAYSWISASTNSGIVGDDATSGLVNIGFNFPFYGITQSQLYFSTNGLITFGEGYNWGSWGYNIPATSAPNNFIAPFWDDLVVGSSYNSGAIYYSQGGSAPNRYFVIEWRNITTFEGSSAFSFEAILYENGDIVVQQQSLPASYYSTVGIENSVGNEGLQYLSGTSGLSAPKAIRFYYPTAPTARVLVSPLEAGSFAAISGNVNFMITVTNTGNMGTDTYDLASASAWPVTLYASDGTTALTDTDADTLIDTGPIPQEASATIFAKFDAPGDAQTGDSNAATVTVTSSLDNSKTKTVNVSMSVPARFTGIFEDDTDGAMSLMTANPSGQNTYKATADGYYGYNMATAQTRSGSYLYAWNRSRNIANYSVTEVEYAIIGQNGSIIRPITKLIDNSSVTTSTRDFSPSVTVAPNGTIGLTWRHYLGNSSNHNDNIYFATLDSSGNLLTGPTSITNNTAWGNWDTLNVPFYYYPTIAASDDNRFIIGWEEYKNVGSGVVPNIWYTTRDTAGASVFTPSALTSDNMSFGPVLNSLTGGKAILTWLTDVGGPYYAVVNSSGSVSKATTSLDAGTIYYSPDAVVLANGKVAITWGTDTGIGLSILNSSYALETGPVNAVNPHSSTYNTGISVTTDVSGHIIITWAEGNSYQHLFYALADGTGSIITSPMPYRSSPGVYTSWNGLGSAPYTKFGDVPPTYWAASWIERLANAGITGGCGTGIYCPDDSVTRAQMAVFLLKGIHGSSYSPPPATGGVFGDVLSSHWAAAWIERLFAEGITGGCGTGIYCPEDTVTRAQMAVFLLKAKYGTSYAPPPATGDFSDVATNHWAAAWIEQLAAEGITSGCGTGIYCPESPVTRAQMAVFLVKTFNLP
ncbi:MAG: S-layer homology domain-containing protein [Chloroflexi bacterium]|nr:S-layer homology domain-containing protein [Chloroflexota bacterium]